MMHGSISRISEYKKADEQEWKTQILVYNTIILYWKS